MAASPAPTFQTFKAGVKLQPGQTLAFQPGKGYYAKGTALKPAPEPISDAASGGGYSPRPPVAPAPPRAPVAPTPPVNPYGPTPQSQIDAQASAQAQGGIDAQSAEVRRQQQLAADQAKADEAALTGFSTAAAGMLGQEPDQVRQAYAQAVAEQGALGQGISGQVGADLQAAQSQDDAFAAAQGQSGGHTTNVPDVQTTLQMLQGVIPGTELAAQGAAAATEAAAQPRIALDAGRQELDKRMAQAHADADGYAQQLIQIAATYPTLKAQALQQLNQYELDKANYRQQVRMNTQAIANQRQDNARQNRALRDQEKAAGLTASNDAAKINAEYAYKYAALQFKSREDAAKAAAAGKIIDVPASKALGHVVYKDGSQNPAIKVAQSGATTAQQKSVQNRYKDTVKAKSTAVDMARSLRGKPQLAGKASPTYLGKHGKYIAAPKYRALGQGKPGSVYPDGTTDNLKRAAYAGDSMTYQQAADTIYQKVGGDTLAARYNLPKATIMQWIATALNNAGWSK